MLNHILRDLNVKWLYRNYLGGPVVKTASSKQGIWVQYLVGKQKSHMTYGPQIQNIKQKQSCDKFNKDFKNGPHLKIVLKILK